MYRRLSFLIFLFLFIPQPAPEPSRQPDLFIIWNTGQGQWTTLYINDVCLHFDMGGERAPLDRIRQLCQFKENILAFTHFDKDHYSFLPWANRNLTNICLLSFPPPINQNGVWQEISKISLCKPFLPGVQLKVFQNYLKRRIKKLDRNKVAHAFILMEKILITGDLPAAQEKALMQRLPRYKLSLYVVGHHGSKTSTSTELLERYPRLQMAVVSARRRRYGHPHLQTLKRLKNSHISVLTTEAWGNIWHAL